MSLENASNNNINQNQNFKNNLNSNPSTHKPIQTGYALSSWNYGSFHYSNPRYVKTDNPVKLVGAETEKFNFNNNVKSDRPTTVQVNKFGKRKLTENEKIVTEDYLKAMNDSKNIRGTSRRLNQNRSSSTIRTSKKDQKDNYLHNAQVNYTTSNYDNQNSSNMNRNNNNVDDSNNDNMNKNKYNNQINQVNTHQTHNNSNYSNNNVHNRSRFSSGHKDKERIYKFGMTFDEWNENKNRQIQVTKNLNLLKEHELKEYEKIEQKIEENYKKIK